MRKLWVLALTLVSGATAARAQQPPPPPYSLPWQLRPAAAASSLRADTVLAFPDGEQTTVTMLSGGLKVGRALVPSMRLGIVAHSPDDGESAVSLVNPALGATWLHWPTPELRVAAFLGLTLPIGMGGGDSPDPAVAAATSAGVYARSAMDNAMFAVNYLTTFPGIGVAWVKGGLTLQAEATVLVLARVRGAGDDLRINSTFGLHAGYFIVPLVSVGAELRHQRWLATPSFVEANAAARDATTAALGVRLHLRAGGARWIRPGIAYTRGLDDPMAAAGYHIVQLDVPFTF
jgi:hypothetical protein